MVDVHISDVVFLIGDDGSHAEFYPENITLPFDVDARDLLVASQKRLTEQADTVSLMDALANAKRAVNLRVDELLYLFALDGLAARKKWSLPAKLDVLAYLGLTAPSVLKKLNSWRNAMEHEYRSIPLPALEDFVDAVALFLDSTWWYLTGFADHALFHTDSEAFNFDITLHRDARLFAVKVLRNPEGTQHGPDITVPVDDPWYQRLLAAYVAGLFGRQGLVQSWEYASSPDDDPA